MSFGFSFSDLLGLAHVTIKIYNEFKEAPETCEAFRLQILQLHQIASQTHHLIQSKGISLGENDIESLEACIRSCKTLIFQDIFGLESSGDGDAWWRLETMEKHRHVPGSTQCFRSLRRKWDERKFAAQIPKLHQAVSFQVQRLIVIHGTIAHSRQVDILESQQRAESSNLFIRSSQARLEAASKRVEETQGRIEQQLQSIIASKSRHQDSIMAQSLDASSPEGRETWMTLGRLLRLEGITTAMIKQNRDVLVKVMKRTFQEDSTRSSPQSYHTAVQSLSDVPVLSCSDKKDLSQRLKDQSPGAASIALLGSAPPPSATFTNEFLSRQKGRGASLDRPENVEEGLQSLLSGMSEKNTVDRPGSNFANDEICLEGFR